HDKSDVHGEVCSAADKLARTVERVDQEKSIIEGWTFPPAHCLLSHDGNARRATSKGFQNNLFCLAIGSRDRARIGLRFDGKTGAAVAHDGCAGGDGRPEELVRKSLVVDIHKVELPTS